MIVYYIVFQNLQSLWRQCLLKTCNNMQNMSNQINDAGLMCPWPMCPWPKVLGCCAPWTKRPLDILPLTDVSQPWTASGMELAPSAPIAASVDLRHLMDQWGVWPASPVPLISFIGFAPLRRMHARPTHRTPPLRSAKARGSWKSGVASLNPIWI